MRPICGVLSVTSALRRPRLQPLRPAGAGGTGAPAENYSSETSFRAPRSPACSVSGEAAGPAFIQKNKTAISEKEGNCSGVHTGRLAEQPLHPGPRPRAAPPRSAPPPARLPRPIWSLGGRRREGRRARRRCAASVCGGAAPARAACALVGDPRGRGVLRSEQWDSAREAAGRC